MSGDSTFEYGKKNLLLDIVLLFLPSFVRSTEFITWNESIPNTNNCLHSNLDGLKDQNHVESETYVADREWFNRRCLPYVHSSCLHDVMGSYYLYNFLQAAESLPIGITLCKVSKQSYTKALEFPIIYVNEMYSLMTGYSQKEILGFNLNDFVYSNKANYCRDLSDHLKQAKSYMTTVDDYCKNGYPYQHLIGVKPIKDSRKEYTYVITIHMDAYDEREMEQNRSVMYNLLLKLPSVLNAFELQLPCASS